MKLHKHLVVPLLISSLFFCEIAYTQNKFASPAVLQSSPVARSLTAPISSNISITFDQSIEPSSVNSETFRVFGRWSGPAEGVYSFDTNGTTVTFTPDHSFSAGEQVMVVLSKQIETIDAMPLSNGHSFQFWTATLPSQPNFGVIDVQTTRTTPGITTRSYGGIATDLNNDGWLDVSIINEDSADVRVFMNQADGRGLFDPFLQPTTPINDRASPNEPADFNNDGNADLAVGNINTNSISILLGNGDGTFAPQQEVFVGQQPRGVAVLDVDADGDLDIANTNSAGSGSISLLINNGDGVFGPPMFFDGGGDAEWSLAAADMNEDGMLDLILSARINGVPAIIVQTNMGDGTFVLSDSVSASGLPWMLNVADLNGDGHDDVAVVNSSSNNGSIFFGDGSGSLTPATNYSTDAFPLATDLGDIDGDGDLDWVTSSFSGDWLLFLNDGAGNFSFSHEFDAQTAASCALMLDFDNDQILDLALIDELADEVVFVKNGPDTDEDGVFDTTDNCTEVANSNQIDVDDDGYGNACDADFDNDCITSFLDFSLLAGAFLEDVALYDLNSDGIINFIDISLFSTRFLSPPGPSGVGSLCGLPLSKLK